MQTVTSSLMYPINTLQEFSDNENITMTLKVVINKTTLKIMMVRIRRNCKVKNLILI